MTRFFHGQGQRMQRLYEDEYFIAVYKPAGMLVHRTRIAADTGSYLLQRVRDLSGRHVFPVHRLDRPTAGVMLFAFTREVAGEMMPLFAGGEVAKRYVAVVRGYLPGSGVVDHPLKPVADPVLEAADTRSRDAVAAQAQTARTKFSCLGSTEVNQPVGRYASARYSLLELRPEQGRRHQLRRHMKHVFHPIIGDTTYGDGRHNRFVRSYAACHRLMLVATELGFTHPVTGASLCISTQPDDDFIGVLDRLALGFPGS